MRVEMGLIGRTVELISANGFLHLVFFSWQEYPGLSSLVMMDNGS